MSKLDSDHSAVLSNQAEATRPHVLFSLHGAAAAWAAVQAVGLAAVLVVSRLLGPQEYGRLGIALSLSVYAFFICQWGSDPLVTRNLVRASPADARRQIAAYIRQKQFLAFVLIGLALVLLLLLNAAADPLMIALGILYGVVQAFTMAPAFDARNRIGTYTSFAALRQVAYFLAVLTPYFAASLPRNALIVLAAGVCAVFVQLFLEWFWIRKNYGSLDWTGATPEGFKLWIESAPLAIALIAMQIPNYFGPLILEIFGRKESLGHLVLSNQLTIAAISFLGLIARNVHTRLSAINDPLGREFKNRVWVFTMSLTAAGIAAALVLSIASTWVVRAFPASYAPAAAIFSVDIWRIVGALASAVLGSALICQQRIQAYMICHILAFGVAIVLAVTLIAPYDARGVVAASAIGRAAFPVFAAIVLCLPSARKTEA